MRLLDLARPAEFVPESKRVSELLAQMQRRKFHIAMVTDEYGSVSGLVTMENLLEELVGEITDEYDREEPKIEALGENCFRVNGKVSIDELNDVLEVKLPKEEWDTVGGLVLALLGEIPKEGREVRFDDLRFKAEKVHGRRIASVLVTRDVAEPERAVSKA
jgi:CBS domain containing-hemolysin-like protein